MVVLEVVLEGEMLILQTEVVLLLLQVQYKDMLVVLVAHKRLVAAVVLVRLDPLHPGQTVVLVVLDYKMIIVLVLMFITPVAVVEDQILVVLLEQEELVVEV
tara:strand:- start:139 stop:444 length:306 start_codon:yes stop_codon:yes gene_type:complete